MKSLHRHRYARRHKKVKLCFFRKEELLIILNLTLTLMNLIIWVCYKQMVVLINQRFLLLIKVQKQCMRF